MLQTSAIFEWSAVTKINHNCIQYVIMSIYHNIFVYLYKFIYLFIYLLYLLIAHVPRNTFNYLNLFK